MDPSTERKWQKKWEESGIFRAEIDRNRPKFLITVPWPYTNGPLHIGHGRTYTLADVIARYKRLRGFNVLFPMAFHQSGTPILAFSERIRMGEKKTVQQYRENLSEYEEPDMVDKRLEEFKYPEKIAAYFSERIVKDFTYLGYSIDWRRRFTSADPFYQDFVKWQFEKLHGMGLIKKGEYPILYSVEDKNAVGEDDISDGDVDKVSVEEYTAVIFRGESFSLITGSLRPETLFGVTNLWISPNCRYVKFKMDSNTYVVSNEAFEKLGLQRSNIELIGTVSSNEILNQEYITPFDGRKIRAYYSSFVDPDNGTGIVYSVPGHAVWDFIAIKDAGIHIKPIYVVDLKNGEKTTVDSLISELGISSLGDADKLKEATQQLYKVEFYSGFLNQNNGEFSGMPVKEARDAIKSSIFKLGNGFIFYEVSRKAQTRGGSKVVVAVLKDQWFIDYSAGWWKKASHDLVSRMLFYPDFYRNAMHDAVDWLRERPCARRRGIGTRLPFNREWVIESLSDSTIYPAVYSNVEQVMKIFSELGKFPEDLVNFVYTDDDNDISKYPEHIQKLAREARDSRNYWYGVDVRLTTSPHMSNHLAFYVMNHAALFREHDQPKGIIISGLVLSNSAKISKSKGNAISLLKITNRYSADLYRLFATVNADISSILDWNETDLSAVKRKYDAFLEIMDETHRYPEQSNRQVEDWFDTKFILHRREFIEKMDRYDIRGAYVSIFYEVINDLKYVENRGGDVGKCVRSIKRDWIIALTPVIPHTCEELWEKSGNDGFASKAELKDDAGEQPDLKIIDSENYLQNIVRDVREIMKATGITPDQIRIETCNPRIREATVILLENRMKDIPADLRSVIPDFMKNKRNIDLTNNQELQVLKDNANYLSATFKCKVFADEARIEPGKKNAWPGRPLIRLN